jgi:hypothetical protein
MPGSHLVRSSTQRGPGNTLSRFPGTLAARLCGRLIWANAFEYLYHRCLVHFPSNYLARLHQLHHASVGTPLEVEHLNLGGRPPLVLAAFALNGLVITFLADVLQLRISPGIFIAFAVYVIAVEEVHWRIHTGGWFPVVAALWARTSLHFSSNKKAPKQAATQVFRKVV